VIKVGERAPDAEVFPKPREPRSLSELRGDGPSVLLFFPMAFSSTCTEEICNVSENFSAWESVGANVIALSVDSPYTNIAFAASTNAKFPIVSDFNRAAARAFGVLRADLGGLKDTSERAVFVIDAAGVVRYTWIGEHPGVFPPLEEVRAAVAELA
jgi:glutaredoxin-dependent peroxiredoxin